MTFGSGMNIGWLSYINYIMIPRPKDVELPGRVQLTLGAAHPTIISCVAREFSHQVSPFGSCPGRGSFKSARRDTLMGVMIDDHNQVDITNGSRVDITRL